MTGNFLVAERRLRIRYQEQEQRLAANGATRPLLCVPGSGLLSDQLAGVQLVRREQVFMPEAV